MPISARLTDPTQQDVPPTNGQEKPPSPLRAYEFHGVDVHPGPGHEHIGACPFCQGEQKWYVNEENGLFDCKICGIKGNITSFLRTLHAESDKATSLADLEVLAASRGLLDPMTLNYWGVCKSIINNEWMAPGWSNSKKVTQLYKYSFPRREAEKRVLMCTTTVPHALHGINLYDPAKPAVWLVEGLWNAAALWEMLRQTKQTEDGLQITGAEESSLLAQVNILGVPGALVFRKEWASLLADKQVILFYDNDHPRTVSGRVINGAGITGVRKAVDMMASFAPPPREIHFLQWGDIPSAEYRGYDPALPHGHDVRDVLKEGTDERSRLPLLKYLLDRLLPIPSEWIGGRSLAEVSRGGVRLQVGQCSSWEELINVCRKALNWTEGLDRAFSVMLASVISVKSDGDPLWVKIVAPPSTGKSTLAEAISVATDYVFALSTLTGFHSGFKTDKHGEEDHGLIPKIKDKTLIVKDADTILSAANKDKILSEARDLYDNVCRTFYLHGVSREYNDVRTTIILCGTKSLHALDGSELGERFVDSVIMEEIDASLEEDVCKRSVYTAWNISGNFANGKASVNASPEMIEMKRMTGGFVNFLRENAQELIRRINSKPPSDELVKQLMACGIFVAYIRARPSKRHDEGDDREFGARLSKQFTRLAICLAAVLGKEEVDEEVLRRVRKTALDTARGRTLDICKHLYSSATKAITYNAGTSTGNLALLCNSTEERKRKMLRFLRRIGAVEAFRKVTEGLNGEKIVSSQVKWRLTERMVALWKSVVLNER